MKILKNYLISEIKEDFLSEEIDKAITNQFVLTGLEPVFTDESGDELAYYNISMIKEEEFDEGV